MPSIYLSPSTQEYNTYINGGTEEEYMNYIADAMEPYLISSGIRFTRNTPQMTAGSSITQSNAGTYDLHLALHSNAAPPGSEGQYRGTDVYYYPTSVKGKQAADIIARNLQNIYPIPSLVKTISSTSIGEVRRTTAPSVLIEFAYHDNEEDANWIKNNIEAIAQTVVIALTEYFGIPFISPQPTRIGTVSAPNGYANIHTEPDPYSPVRTRVYNGETITIDSEWQGWYVVNYYNIIGYMNSAYVTLSE